jgi:hypothetical protein
MNLEIIGIGNISKQHIQLLLSVQLKKLKYLLKKYKISDGVEALQKIISQ